MGMGAPGPCGSSSSLFSSGLGGGGGLFGAKPAAPAPVAATAAAGPKVSVAHWLQHAHADIKAQGLVHQHAKLHRFLQPSGYPVGVNAYVRERINELAQVSCRAV